MRSTNPIFFLFTAYIADGISAARAVGFPFFLTLADYWFGESKKSAEGRYLRVQSHERTRRDFNSFQFAVFVPIYADVLCFSSSFILQYKRLAPIFLRRTFFQTVGFAFGDFRLQDYGVSLSNHIQIIQHRHSVIIYPEGITTPTGEVMIEWAHGGVAFLAEKTGLPIVPIYIQGVRRMKFWKEFILRRRRARIVFGKPIYARELFENLNVAPNDNRYKSAARKVLLAVADLEKELNPKSATAYHKNFPLVLPSPRGSNGGNEPRGSLDVKVI